MPNTHEPRKETIHHWGGGADIPFNDGSCPADATPSAQPKWVNFTSLDFLNTMNKYLNNPKSLKSFNHYIDCVSRLILNHQRVNAEGLPMALAKLNEGDLADDDSFGKEL